MGHLNPTACSRRAWRLRKLYHAMIFESLYHVRSLAERPRARSQFPWARLPSTDLLAPSATTPFGSCRMAPTYDVRSQGRRIPSPLSTTYTCDSAEDVVNYGQSRAWIPSRRPTRRTRHNKNCSLICCSNAIRLVCRHGVLGLLLRLYSFIIHQGY